MTSYQHQMGTDAACGEHAMGQLRRLAPAADYPQKDRPLRRAGLFDCAPPCGGMTSLQLGRGVVPGPFPIQFARRPLSGLSVVRVGRASSRDVDRPASFNLRSAFTSRCRSVHFDAGHHVCQDKSDVPHRHSSTFSSAGCSDKDQSSERSTQDVGAIIQGLGNV